MPPLHAFTALPSSLLTLLAPRRTPAVLSPNGNTTNAISLFTSTGFQPLTNSSYIESINRLRPDIAIALGDVPYGNKPGTKRIAKMGDRTEQWMTELLSKKAPDQAVFAPILPVDFQTQADYIDYLSDEAAQHIEGLVFYDSDLLPEMPATTSLSELARLSIDEPASPHHILRQIALGMDIFTVPFIGFATDAGIALTFRFPRSLPDEIDSPEEGSSVRLLGIDMWASKHATSLLPLSTKCTCYTCTSHHRAYIQHLLAAKEMLGWVLIQVHNHHIMSEFFAAVRKSIRGGTFEDDCNLFAKEYESELPEKSGQGPRVRGYHFKSDGPGEGKKNKAPWGNLGEDGKDSKADSPLVPTEGAVELQDKGFAEVAN